MKAEQDSVKVISLRISAVNLRKIDSYAEANGFYNTRNDLLVSILRAGYKRVLKAASLSESKGDYSLLAGIVVGMRHTAAAFDNGTDSKDSQLLIRIPVGFYESLVDLTDIIRCSLIDFVRSELFLYINRVGPLEIKDRYSRILDSIDRDMLDGAVAYEEIKVLEADLDRNSTDLE